MLRKSFLFLLKTFFFPLPLPGAAGFKRYGPARQGRGIACTALEPALWAECREAPAAPQGQCRRHPLRAAGGKFFEVWPEGVDLGVRWGVRAEIWNLMRT